jgi:hypothetical protein
VPKIDAIFKEDDIILDSPMLALLSINNFLIVLNYKCIYSEVYEEHFYPCKLIEMELNLGVSFYQDTKSTKICSLPFL